MTRIDKLNAASDLKRIAYWLAVGDVSQLELIDKLWKNLKNRKEIRKFLADYGICRENLGALFKNKKRRLFFAEQALLTSLQLQG